jgi:predicted molibdopterin-dependent oxidoreductase YjgC
MINRRPFFHVAVCAAALFVHTVAALANDAPTQARQFFNALANADTGAMKKFYAETVTLKAGSEFLKHQWAIHDNADRSRDLLLPREQLLKGYATFFQKIGKERWREVMRETTDAHLAFVTVEKDDEPLSGVKRGDVVFIVKPGGKSDVVLFVFRRFDSGEGLIVAELTDY